MTCCCVHAWKEKKKSSQGSPSNVCWWSSIGAGVGLRGKTVPWPLKLQLSGWIFFLTKLYTTLGWSWIVRSLLRPPSLFRHRFSSIHSWNLDPQRPSAVSLSLSSGATPPLLLEAPETHMQSTAAQSRGSFTLSVNLSHVNSEHETASGGGSTLNGRWRERRAEIPGTSQPNKGYTFL